MENNMKAIHFLHDNLNRLKGASAGYTTENRSALMMEHEGIVYKVSIERVDTGEVGITHIKNHLESPGYPKPKMKRPIIFDKQT